MLFFNTFVLALVGNLNILILQYTSMFIFNSALKRLGDTPQSKSNATTRWIVVKVSYFTTNSSYILILSIVICT